MNGMIETFLLKFEVCVDYNPLKDEIVEYLYLIIVIRILNSNNISSKRWFHNLL